MIARFTEDHDRIRAIAAELGAHLAQPEVPRVPDFARCRWELMRELATHLACERRALGPMPGCDRALDEALNAHMLEWTGAAIERGWPRYRRAAKALLRRLDARMAHEERAVFPLLA